MPNRKSQYRIWEEWLELDKYKRLQRCPFCSKECTLEALDDLDENLVRYEGGSFPFWMYYQEKEKPCIEGFVYDSTRIRPHKFDSKAMYIKYTSSLKTEDETILCRPSCDECNLSIKLYFQLLRIRTNINRHIQKERRKERMKEATREPINRMEIYDRDKGICHICNKPVDPNDFHLDHVLPLAKGGSY